MPSVTPRPFHRAAAAATGGGRMGLVTPPDATRPALGTHTMPPVRARYLAAARTALELLAAPEVRDRWDEASVLAGFAVGDLAGHLALSGVLIVEAVLDQPDPRSPAPITAGQYYGAFTGADDPESELNVGVRERAYGMAVKGHEGVVAAASQALERLADRLVDEPADRQGAPPGKTPAPQGELRRRGGRAAGDLEDPRPAGGPRPRPPAA